MKLKTKGSGVDSSIFESFTKLTSDDENLRIKGASGLIKILEETSEDKVNFVWKMCARSGSLKYSVSDSEAVGLCTQASDTRQWIVDISFPHRFPHSTHRSPQRFVRNSTKSREHNRHTKEGIPGRRGQGKDGFAGWYSACVWRHHSFRQSSRECNTIGS